MYLRHFRVKPNVHGAVVDYFNFVKFKTAVREEIFFDNGRQVLFVDFDLALDETLIFVVLDWKNDAHVFYPSVSFLALIP
jgi:hypothetical protein